MYAVYIRNVNKGAVFFFIYLFIKRVNIKAVS